MASDSSTVNNTEELQTTDGVAPAEVDSNKVAISYLNEVCPLTANIFFCLGYNEMEFVVESQFLVVTITAVAHYCWI